METPTLSGVQEVMEEILAPGLVHSIRRLACGASLTWLLS